MNNIAIIGAGQLGSRHLQAMALYKEPLNIYLIDPSEESREIAQSRFQEVDQHKNKNIIAASDMSNLPLSLKFVVIATSSLPRFKVMEQLVNTCKVEYLLLEKFLFPMEEDYLKAKALIKNYNVTAYVNCARRLWPNYQQIKKTISEDTEISLSVEGVNWGLGSNTIHFLDLFNYLTGKCEVELSIEGLTDVLTNKRQGYIELSGNLIGKVNAENRLNLISHKDGNFPFTITIESDQHKYMIYEQKQEIKYYEDGKESVDLFQVYYQSELTNKVFEQLMEKGECVLTSFEESSVFHLKVLKAFNEFLGEREGVIT